MQEKVATNNDKDFDIAILYWISFVILVMVTPTVYRGFVWRRITAESAIYGVFGCYGRVAESMITVNF
jgi:hypothetical protein